MYETNKNGGPFYEMQCRVKITLIDCGCDGNHWSIEKEIEREIDTNKIKAIYDVENTAIEEDIKKVKKQIEEI